MKKSSMCIIFLLDMMQCDAVCFKQMIRTARGFLMEKEFCTMREAADSLGISLRKVAGRVAVGELPSAVIGKRSRRIPMEAIKRIKASALAGGNR